MFNGLTRGLQMIAEFLKELYAATSRSDIETLQNLQPIMAKWFGELTGASITVMNYRVIVNIASFLFGGDPFAGSRALWQQYKADKGK